MVEVGAYIFPFRMPADVTLYARYIFAHAHYRGIHLLLPASGDKNIRAFVHKLLRRREANTGAATTNECNFSFKLTDIFLLSCQPPRLALSALGIHSDDQLAEVASFQHAHKGFGRRSDTRTDFA